MFNNLVVSTSNARQQAKQSAYFGITAVIYGLFFIAIFVWSIFSFDLSALSQADDLAFNSLVAPVPLPENVPPIPQEVNQPKRTDVSAGPQRNFDILKDPVVDINTPREPPKGVSTEKNNSDVVREGVPFIRGGTKSRGGGGDSDVPNRGEGTGDFKGISPTNQTKAEEPAEIERPPDVKPKKVQPPKTTIVSKGVINGIALSLPKPAYSPAAKIAGVSGTVNVQVMIDETGKVISATAVSGHPLLRSTAVAAAKQAKFTPTKLSEQPVKVTGIISYNFVKQ